METAVVEKIKTLGWSIERGESKAVLRQQHEELQQAVADLIENVQEFKMNTITQLHNQKTKTVKNEWFITPFSAYLKS